MTSIINILSKNPELADCKSRLKKYLSRDERIFLTKKMLEMTCYEVKRVASDACLHFFPNDNGEYIESLSEKFKIKTKNQTESAVGFTCFMDTVLRASSFESKSKKILVPFNINDKIKKSLINKNYIVFNFFGEISDITKIAKKHFCTHIYINKKINKI